MRKVTIDQDTIDQLPLENIDRVAFYKRDELTTDLICCDVERRGDQRPGEMVSRGARRLGLAVAPSRTTARIPERLVL